MRRLKARPGVVPDQSYLLGWEDACLAVLHYLSGQAERYSRPGGLQGHRAAKGKGGLRGPGKGARRAQ